MDRSLVGRAGRLLGRMAAVALVALFLSGVAADPAGAQTRKEGAKEANDFIQWCVWMGGEPVVDTSNNEIFVVCVFSDGSKYMCEFVPVRFCTTSDSPNPKSTDHVPQNDGVFDGGLFGSAREPVLHVMPANVSSDPVPLIVVDGSAPAPAVRGETAKPMAPAMEMAPAVESDDGGSFQADPVDIPDGHVADSTSPVLDQATTGAVVDDGGAVSEPPAPAIVDENQTASVGPDQGDAATQPDGGDPLAQQEPEE